VNYNSASQPGGHGNMTEREGEIFILFKTLETEFNEK
jgi:hypothetical protein